MTDFRGLVKTIAVTSELAPVIPEPDIGMYEPEWDDFDEMAADERRHERRTGQ